MKDKKNTCKHRWQQATIAFSLTVLTAAQPMFAVSARAQSGFPQAGGGAAEQVQTNLINRLGLSSDEISATDAAKPFEANPVTDSAAPNADPESTRNSTIRPDVHGTLSVENFQGTQSNLYSTHESAAGFRDYLATWHQPNYAKQDTGVSVWSYHDVAGGDNFDLWSTGGIDYGVDGVLAAWHSGHGGMSGLNTFIAPMGANWAGRGWNAVSTNMRLGGNNGGFGDERLRYLVWDTCNSVMVSAGHDPYSTWGTRANGIRMVFGYETVSIDSPDYGKFFWEEWNKGKSLTYSHLDSSWRINNYQSPAVVAFGATRDEATSRLENERYLTWDAVSANWAAWRWYYSRSLAASKLEMPDRIAVYRVENKGKADNQIEAIAKRIGINSVSPQAIQKRSFGAQAIETDLLELVVEQDGDFELRIKKNPAANGKNAVDDAALIEEAKNIAEQYNLTNSNEYQTGSVRYLNQNAGSANVSQGQEETIEKTVVLNQMIDGLAFTDPDAGHVEITFDAQTGAVKNLRSSLRAVANSSSEQNFQTPQLTLEQARQTALKDFAKSQRSNDERAIQILPESESIGYRVIEGKILPVYRALIINSNFPQNRPHEAIIPLLSE